MQLPHVSAGFLISLGIATAFEILFPLALAFYVSRRLHVRWRYFWYGVAVFAALLPVEVSSASPEQLERALVRTIWLFTLMTVVSAFLVWLGVPDERPRHRPRHPSRR